MNVGVSSNSGSGGRELESGNRPKRIGESELTISTTQQPLVQTALQSKQNLTTDLAEATITNSDKPSKPSFLKVALQSDISYSAIGATILSYVITASQPLTIFSIPLILITVGYPVLALKTLINEHRELNKDTSDHPDRDSKPKAIDQPSLFRNVQTGIYLSQITSLVLPAVIALNPSTVSAIGYYDSMYLMFAAIGSYAAGRSANEYTKTQGSLVKKENNLFDTFKILLFANPGASWLIADTLMGVRIAFELGFNTLLSNTKALGFLAISIVPSLLGARSIYKQVTESEGDKINKERIYACVFGTLHATSFALFNLSLGKLTVGIATAFFAASFVFIGRKLYLSTKSSNA